MNSTVYWNQIALHRLSLWVRKEYSLNSGGVDPDSWPYCQFDGKNTTLVEFNTSLVANRHAICYQTDRFVGLTQQTCLHDLFMEMGGWDRMGTLCRPWMGMVLKPRNPRKLPPLPPALNTSRNKPDNIIIN